MLSVTKDTYEYLRQIKPHVFCFQEIRAKKLHDTPSYNILSLLRNTDTQEQKKNEHLGGGICIGIDKKLTFRD